MSKHWEWLLYLIFLEIRTKIIYPDIWLRAKLKFKIMMIVK